MNKDNQTLEETIGRLMGRVGNDFDGLIMADMDNLSQVISTELKNQIDITDSKYMDLFSDVAEIVGKYEEETQAWEIKQRLQMA